ncbi:hydrolase [Kutzneria sp. CA-103260]|nr:hydrolase [Kutzneria sp. CA-103260]
MPPVTGIVARGVLFDMDGVLISTDGAIRALWTEIGRPLGIRISDRDFYQHILGCAPERTVSTLFGELSESVRADVMATVRTREPQLGYEQIPGAVELVMALSAAGAAIALVTGASAVRAGAVLDAMGIRDAFDALVTWGDVRVGKPAPDCYLLAARRLGLAPERCVAVEDATIGVRSAVNAGMPCIGVGADKGLFDAGAEFVVDTLSAVRCQRRPSGVELVAR